MRVWSMLNILEERFPNLRGTICGHETLRRDKLLLYDFFTIRWLQPPFGWPLMPAMKSPQPSLWVRPLILATSIAVTLVAFTTQVAAADAIFSSSGVDPTSPDANVGLNT